MATPSRRTVLKATGALAFVSMMAQVPTASAAGGSLRAVYHLTPPAGWLSDPQRPVFTGSEYQFYYLHSDQDNGPGGWERASTGDNVGYADRGFALPPSTNFPVWTGSPVIDYDNTAGFGAGAVVVLATQPTNGDRYQQEQYLYYSTDGGATFHAYGSPVITNPDHNDWFRDPKTYWDLDRREWVVVIGRQQSIWFYTSPNLIDWTYRSTFGYSSPNIGGFECPDIFMMTGDDGTSHWVLGGSTQGDYSGQPDTFAYWVGSWNGFTFSPDGRDPQWLDWGWDWYAAVTWPNASSPATSRYAIGWMNNWHYAGQRVPTDDSDGYNGQMSVVRELQLSRQSGGYYTLLSQPVAELQNHVQRSLTLGDITTSNSGGVDLPYNGSTYELELDIAWNQLNNVGLSIGKSSDGSRHVNVGVYQGSVYVDRGSAGQSGYSLNGYNQSNAPIDPGARSVHLKILVDRQSVEVFVNAGYTILSNVIFFDSGDTGIAVYADGGTATFSNISVKEFA